MRGHMGVRSALVAIFLACSSILVSPSSAEVVSKGEWWRNCEVWNLTDNCVESIEYFDDSTSKWIKASVERNPHFKDGEITDEDRRDFASGENYLSDKCGYGQLLTPDTCYRIPGAAADGTEQIVETVVYGEKEELKLSFEPRNGPDPFVRARHGDLKYLLRDNSLWRLTVISDSFGIDAGIARAQMKEPSIDVFKGADGHWRVQASGRIQSINTVEAWEPTQPTCEDALKGKNEFKANELNRSFSLNVARYKYEYEKLKGSPPAGVFITNNGGCFSSLAFDTNARIISVSVGGPHFDVLGQEIEGWVEASIRGDVIRKAFNAEPKTMNQAIIEVSYSDGTSKAATSTTKYIASTDKVEIRAYGFTYSKPTVNIKLQPVEQTVRPTKAPVTKVTCVKGKTTKKFTGSKCPTGWKRK